MKNQLRSASEVAFHDWLCRVDGHKSTPLKVATGDPRAILRLYDGETDPSYGFGATDPTSRTFFKGGSMYLPEHVNEARIFRLPDDVDARSVRGSLISTPVPRSAVCTAWDAGNTCRVGTSALGFLASPLS